MAQPQDPFAHLAAYPRLHAIVNFIRRHRNLVFGFEIVVFAIMIPLQLWQVKLLFSWEGWTVVMYAVLMGFAIMLLGISLSARPPAQD